MYIWISEEQINKQKDYAALAGFIAGSVVVNLGWIGALYFMGIF